MVKISGTVDQLYQPGIDVEVFFNGFLELLPPPRHKICIEKFDHWLVPTTVGNHAIKELNAL